MNKKTCFFLCFFMVGIVQSHGNDWFVRPKGVRVELKNNISDAPTTFHVYFTTAAADSAYLINAEYYDYYDGGESPEFYQGGGPTQYYLNTASTGSGDGTTTATTGSNAAWKDISEITGLKAGDTVSFNKGNTWREQLTIIASGSDGSPITFNAYGNGEKPIISGADLISTWGNASPPANSWSATCNTEPEQVWFDGTRGTQETAEANLSATYEWFWAANVLYVYSATDPDTAYTSPGIEASVRAICINGSSKSYITIDELNCVGWNDRGIYFLGGTNIIMQNNTISGGSDTTRAFGIQFQGNNTLRTGIEVKDNTFGTIAITAQEGATFGGVLLQDVDGAIISGNTVNTINTYGIKIMAGGGGDNTGCLIERNNIYGCRAGIFNSHADSSIIRYNQIHDGIGMGVGVAYDSDNVQVYYNLIYDLTKGTNTWNGIDVNHDSQRGKVYNNFVYKVYGNCFVIDDETAACDGWLIKNNIFDATQNGSDDVTIFALPWKLNGAGISWTSDYNCCYPKIQTLGSVANPTHYDLDGFTYYTLAGWILAKSQEANSISSDPLITDPANDNFHLTSLSPAIDAGEDVGLTHDIAGNPLPQGYYFDIGPYEFLDNGDQVIASANATPTSGYFPLAVDFTGTAVGGSSPYTYNWDFGDGTSSPAQNPSHTFLTANSFTVTLTVADNNNNQDTDTIIITASGQFSLALAATTENPAPGQGGTTDPIPGTYAYTSGNIVPINAIPNANYRFAKWSGDVPSADTYNDQINIAMNQNRNLTAKFFTQCGDVNGDSLISPVDAQVTFDIFLGKLAQPTEAQKENADVNCDGTKTTPKVTPADAQAIFREFLGQNDLPGDCSCNSRQDPATSSISIQSFSDITLKINAITGQNGQEIVVPVIISGSSVINALGFDLQYSSDILQFLRMETTSTSQMFAAINCNPLEDGLIRLGGYTLFPIPIQSSQVLGRLIFKVVKDVEGLNPFSILNTVDDLKNARIKIGR